MTWLQFYLLIAGMLWHLITEAYVGGLFHFTYSKNYTLYLTDNQWVTDYTLVSKV